MDSTTKNATFELVVPSSPEYLALLRSCARWFCERTDLSQNEISRTILCVVEAVTNIIRHAYQGSPDETIVIRFRESDDVLEFEFVDEGHGVPPATLESRSVKDDECGGRGVLLMKECMDGFHYESIPEGGARLVLSKVCRRDSPCVNGSSAANNDETENGRE